MRRLGLLDLLIIVAIVALLIFAASQDFGRYAGRTLRTAPAPASTPP